MTQYSNRIASISELSPSANEESKPEPKENEHTWGEDENEVGLHITESVDPSVYLSPGNLPLSTFEEPAYPLECVK